MPFYTEKADLNKGEEFGSILLVFLFTYIVFLGTKKIDGNSDREKIVQFFSTLGMCNFRRKVIKKITTEWRNSILLLNLFLLPKPKISQILIT
jgi:hypothetical protein